jgi:hypothetical protein
MRQARLTAAQLERTVASLCGLRITAVDYALGTSSTGGTAPADHASQHTLTKGFQITTDIGTGFTFVSGTTFNGNALELYDRPITEVLPNLSEPGAPAVLPSSDHPRWRPLLERTITHASLAWFDWVSGSAPLLIRLDFAPAERRENSTVWVVSGRWAADGRFAIGTGELTVIFERTDAVRARVAREDDPAK